MRQFAFKNLTVNVAGFTALCIQTMPTCAVACSPLAAGTSICAWPSNITNPTCPGVSLVPTGCLHNSLIPTITNCQGWSLVPTLTCQVGISNGGTCGLAHSTLPPTTFITDVIQTAVDPSELHVLREQLTEAMTAVDERAGQLQSELAPQTLEEAELVESQLKEALAELKELKKRMGDG